MPEHSLDGKLQIVEGVRLIVSLRKGNRQPSKEHHEKAKGFLAD